MASTGVQFQTSIAGDGNDHKAETFVVWNGHIYLGGYFKKADDVRVCMALKKFQINLDQNPVTLTEEWSYSQHEDLVSNA